MNLIKGDCLVELKKLPDKSINFFYLDLPYGQTSCDWDVKLDHEALWIELKRLAKSDRTPFFLVVPLNLDLNYIIPPLKIILDGI